MKTEFNTDGDPLQGRGGPMLKLGDKITIVGVVIIAVTFIAWNAFGVKSGEHLTAVITHNSKLVKTINLSNLNKPDYINLNEEGVHQVIQAETGRIRFLESDCPHKTCVKTGWLTKPGDRAVCIPSRVVITIVGDGKQVDTLAY